MSSSIIYFFNRRLAITCFRSQLLRFLSIIESWGETWVSPLNECIDYYFLSIFQLHGTVSLWGTSEQYQPMVALYDMFDMFGWTVGTKSRTIWFSACSLLSNHNRFITRLHLPYHRESQWQYEQLLMSGNLNKKNNNSIKLIITWRE